MPQVALQNTDWKWSARIILIRRDTCASDYLIPQYLRWQIGTIMKTLTFEVSKVQRATEPLDEIPYHQAIKHLLGQPLVDPKQKLKYEIDQLASDEVAYREEEPSRIDELLAESKQKLALATANEATAIEPMKEPIRKKIQIFQKQIAIYGGMVESERKQRVLKTRERAATKLDLEEKLAMLETSESPTASIETCSRYHGQLLAHVREHPVLGALKLAFSFHHPVVLSPDMFWLLICQGVAQHVNLHSESLRVKFVQHTGKVPIEVRRDDFIKGSLENPWSEVIDEICKEVGKHIGSMQDLFIPNFSTTSATDRTVAAITLLDAVESFFEYRFYSLCGIPEITLEGTVEDWETLADRVEAFSEFDLEWWLVPLRPILRELVAAARGDMRKAFWESIYKFESESGGDVITGWITAFFPYFWDTHGNPTVKNKWLVNGGEKLQLLLDAKDYGPKVPKVPSSLSRVPFVWIYDGQKFDMELLGGFVGVAQDNVTLGLKPEIGWAIRQANPSMDEQVKARWKPFRPYNEF